MAADKIHIVITGGTVDSVWNGAQDSTVVSEHTVLPEYFKNLNLYQEFEFSEVCMKDSRALTPEDIQNVLKTIEQSEAKKFIITHGTYTMPDTARFIKGNIKAKDKTVVLTGSMIPLKGFDMSDAGFNLGYAVARAHDLPQGVYICMNGRTFTPEEAAKNLAEGKFYSIFQDKQ